MTDENESLSESVQQFEDVPKVQLNEGRVSTQIDIDDITGHSQSGIEFLQQSNSQESDSTIQMPPSSSLDS